MNEERTQSSVRERRRERRREAVSFFFVTHRFLWLMITGALLTGLTVIFPQIGFLQWLAMIPLFLGTYRFADSLVASAKRAYVYGFLTVFCYYIVIYHWFLRMYPMDFVGLTNEESVFVVILGWLGLSIVQALPGGLMFLFYHWLNQKGVFEMRPFLRPFVLPILWVILEWISTIGWTGVPLGRLCLGQIKLLPIMQSASLLGSYFVSFLLLLVNALLAYALYVAAKRVLCVALSGAILVASLAFGFVRMAIRKNETHDRTVSVAVVQGNLSVYESWDDNSYRLMKEVHATLTKQAVKAGAELVIWPETTFPYTLSEIPDLQAFASNLARNCQVPLIIGALDTDEVDNDYNVLYFVEKNGTIREETYQKRRLVPFGEYVPMGDFFSILLPPLADMMALGAGLTAGEEATYFETEWGNAGALICYDSIYEDLTRDSVLAGAEWMIVASNDSWFRNSAAVDLHQAQAQLRAIESGRYFASAVNTGISSLITSEGEIIGWLEKDVSGYAIADISARNDQTLYMTVGNLFVYCCMLLCAVLWFYGLYLRKHLADIRREQYLKENEENVSDSILQKERNAEE